MANEIKCERGSKYRIDSLNNPFSHLTQRLSCMGLVAGVEIEVTNVAPLGEPIEIKSHGYNLSLRRDEISKLRLSPIAN